MELTGSPAFLEAMTALKRSGADYRIRDVVIDEVAKLQAELAAAMRAGDFPFHIREAIKRGDLDVADTWAKKGRELIAADVARQQELEAVRVKLEFFRPRCAQCDAPLEVHPYQCKLWGLCDACVGDWDAGADTVSPPLEPDHAVVEYTPGQPVDLSNVKARYLHFRPKPDPAVSEVTPEAFMLTLRDGPPIELGADFEIAPSKTVITAKLSDVKVVTTPIPPGVCPHCDKPLHDPNPEKNAAICPEIPF